MGYKSTSYQNLDEDSKGQYMNVIVVDDEKYSLKDLLETVQEAISDASIESFDNPDSAKEWAKNNRVDIAFLDIEMPGQDGISLAKEIQNFNPKTNIIFVTGYSNYALDAFSVHAADYIMKPITPKKIHVALENLRTPIKTVTDRGLRIQTFGNFEVFYNGTPLSFPRKKAKELLAYLIHKKGTGCTAKEAASVLFEDKPYNLSIQKQMQTVLSTLKKVLQGVGADDILIKKYNNVSIDINKVNCDYYDFLNEDPAAINQYTGEYMANYGWAEFTVGYLDSKV